MCTRGFGALGRDFQTAKNELPQEIGKASCAEARGSTSMKPDISPRIHIHGTFAVPVPCRWPPCSRELVPRPKGGRVHPGIVNGSGRHGNPSRSGPQLPAAGRRRIPYLDFWVTAWVVSPCNVTRGESIYTLSQESSRDREGYGASMRPWRVRAGESGRQWERYSQSRFQVVGRKEVVRHGCLR